VHNEKVYAKKLLESIHPLADTVPLHYKFGRFLLLMHYLLLLYLNFVIVTQCFFLLYLH